jgi:hypothetical protein
MALWLPVYMKYISRLLIPPKLKFYYGFGAHVGAVGSGVYKRFGSDDNYYNDSHILLGADAF